MYDNYLNIQMKKLNNLFFNKYLNLLSNNIILISFLFIWVFEWLFLFNYCLSLDSFVYLFYPYRLPIMLILIFIFFIYVWGVSVWRRTQYGKFTRGDRKLWYKGYASFWLFELLTVLGVFLCAAWMNWGPRPLFPKKFITSKKVFLIEVSFFTYIIWLIYLLRFSIKWNKWKVQITIVYIILFITFCLIWRDILVIIGRENINLKNSSRWRYISSQIVIYSLIPDWWFNHFFNQHSVKISNTLFYNLSFFLEKLDSNIIIDVFNKNINLNNYERYKLLPIFNLNRWFNSSLLLNNSLDFKKNFFFFTNNNKFYTQNYSGLSNESNLFYPRRVGYLTKRIAIWTFFLFLKIWHHIMLFIWWFFYLIKLNNQKKNSFTWLSITHFNVYCCFLISFLIFLFSYLKFYQGIFRARKDIYKMRGLWNNSFRANLIVNYLMDIFFRKVLTNTHNISVYESKKVTSKFLKNILLDHRSIIFKEKNEYTKSINYLRHIIIL